MRTAPLTALKAKDSLPNGKIARMSATTAGYPPERRTPRVRFVRNFTRLFYSGLPCFAAHQDEKLRSARPVAWARLLRNCRSLTAFRLLLLFLECSVQRLLTGRSHRQTGASRTRRDGRMVSPEQRPQLKNPLPEGQQAGATRCAASLQSAALRNSPRLHIGRSQSVARPQDKREAAASLHERTPPSRATSRASTSLCEATQRPNAESFRR